MAAAGALHVVGVHRAAADRFDRALELGRLVEPVGVQAHRHVVRLGRGQGGVDDLGVGAPVLVDLQPHRAGLDQGIERLAPIGPGARLQPEVHRQELERLERAVHAPGRLLEAGGDQGGHARAERHRHEPRAQQVHVAVDAARASR